MVWGDRSSIPDGPLSEAATAIAAVARRGGRDGGGTVMLTPAGKDLPRPRNKGLIVSQKKPLCQMIATLRTNFFLRHNRAARKSQLKMQAAQLDANQGESECDRNERWLMALGNRKAIPSFFRWRTAVDGGRVVSR
jgi:hypothetical protein